jgi:hypothetical protein
MKTLASLAIHRHAFVCAALLGALFAGTPFAAVAEGPVLLRTFHNPTPAVGDNFGAALAALGSDRLVVGAPYDDTFATNAGAVYLFHTNGTLLATFTNPPPFYGGGYAITTLGSDRVVIGSSGGVRLFTTNGALVSTISGPAGPGGVGFGELVAAFGNDKLLIGAPEGVEPDANGIGAAYLYSTNGTFLSVFRNPDTNIQTGALGFCMAAFGNDRVLISANNYSFGSAHLFNTNGTLLTTITDPAPQADTHFGMSVGAVGTDRILVSAYGDPDPVENDPSRVYVFNTNGALLNTITNPTPNYGDSFGAQIVVLGKDRLVISAPRYQFGSAYVFDINGALLTTIMDPSPAIYDYFGWSLAPFGSQGVIIGAPYDNAGATYAGSAYLFSVPAPPAPPSVAIQRTTTNTVVVSWPSTATGFVLQQNTNGLNSVNWSNVTAGVQAVGTDETLIVNPIGGSRFYRLVKP